MQTLIENGMWPLAAVLIALAALGMFRVPITALLNRTKRIGAGANAIDFSENKATELQQVQAPPSQSQISNYSLGPASPPVEEMEANIKKTLREFNEGDEAKLNRLIRGLAIASLQREFEVIYRLIFGSQLDLLLQANAGGIEETRADEIFQNALVQFPAVHRNGSFEMWIAFVANHQLIERKGGRITVTQKGKEFMQYLVQFGLTTPRGG